MMRHVDAISFWNTAAAKKSFLAGAATVRGLEVDLCPWAYTEGSSVKHYRVADFLEEWSKALRDTEDHRSDPSCSEQVNA